jgi:phytoene synthase
VEFKLSTDEDFSLLADDVKRFDYDRWLACLFTPTQFRASVMAVLAFNSEIARVRETVSEAMLGDIRLQWWRDALQDIQKGTIKAHPVLQALSRQHQERALDLSLMQEMIDMRAKDLDPAPIASEGEMIVYADATGGNLHRLIFNAISTEESSSKIEAVMRSGRAYALCGMLRAVPFHAQNDLLLLPLSLLKSHELNETTVFKAENKDKFKAILRTLKDTADEEFLQAFEKSLSLERKDKPAVLCNALTGIYLNRLHKVDYEPANSRMNLGNIRKIIAMTGYRLFG